MQKLLFICLLVLTILFNTPTGYANENATQNLDSPLLSQIQTKNKLVVGVKSDYPPWGMYSQDSAELIGLEIDLAKDLAQRLNVEVQLVSVNSRNRLQKLEEGSIDIVIATMGDTDARREQSGLLSPNYYSSGVALLSKDDTPFTDWNQLKGREVCLTNGAYFNSVLIERFLIKPVYFEGTRDTSLGLKSGRCVGWAYDNTSLEQTISDGSWGDYSFKLPIILSAPWAIAVPKSEKNTAFGAFVSDTIEDWLRSGLILNLQTKWGLPQSSYLKEQKELYSRQKDDGTGYYCERNVSGAYPSDCQSQEIVNTKAAIAKKPSFIIFLETSLGLNFSPFYSKANRQSLIQGIILTTQLSLFSIIGSLLFSVLFLKISVVKIRGFHYVARIIVAIFRSTPPLILMYIVFFGFGVMVYQNFDWTISSVAAASSVFSVYAGAGIAGVLMPSYVKYTKIASSSDSPNRSPISQTFADNVDAVVANCVNIVKATGLASAIAVPELITTTNTIISEWGNAATMMNVLLIGYFAYVLLVVFLLRAVVKLVVKHG